MFFKTKNRILPLTMAFILLFASIPHIVFGAELRYENLNDLGLQAKSALLMNAETGVVIYEKNSNEAMPPASVTKVMTLLLIYDAVSEGKLNWDDFVTVSEHAAGMGGSQVFLEPYEKQSVRDLTKCVAIASANDASVALGETIAGSESAFVEQMNKKAKALGMNNTNFVNACGLDAEGHVTSAYDIALMSRELITKYPEVLEYTQIWQDSIIHKTRKGESEFVLTNTNKLLKWYDGATGLKTGSTGKALYCLSGTATKNGTTMIGVVMAAPDFRVRFQEVMKLLDYGFANYELKLETEKGYTAGQIKVLRGEDEYVDAVVSEEIRLLMPKGGGKTVEKEIKLAPSIAAPFEAGTKTGEMIFKSDGKEIARCDLVASRAVGKINVNAAFKKLLKKWN